MAFKIIIGLIVLIIIDLALLVVSCVYDPELSNPKQTKSKFIKLLSRNSWLFAMTASGLVTLIYVTWFINEIIKSLPKE